MELLIAKKLFYFFCHQLPDRSLQAAGENFPLCFRCSGVFIGIVTTFFSSAWFGKLKKTLPNNGQIILLSFMIIPFLIDGLGNLFGLWNTSSEIRSMTGLLMGIYIAQILISVSNISKIENNKNSNIFYKNLVISFLFGFVTIIFFLNTRSSTEFTLFVYIVICGWSIVISNIFFGFILLIGINKNSFKKIYGLQ